MKDTAGEGGSKNKEKMGEKLKEMWPLISSKLETAYSLLIQYPVCSHSHLLLPSGIPPLPTLFGVDSYLHRKNMNQSKMKQGRDVTEIIFAVDAS